MTKVPVRPLATSRALSLLDADVLTVDGLSGVRSIEYSALKNQITNGIAGGIVYRGLVDGDAVPNSATAGDYFFISKIGTSQGKNWEVGDLAIYRGAAWDQVKGFLGRVVNVKYFGAVGDGVADDTDAVQRAYDALPAGGGTILFPVGKYRFNLVVTDYNIHIQGEACVKASNGGDSVDAAFIPADLSKPVIQVGNDTGWVRGFRITNCTLYGGEGPFGDCGIYFAGGAYECFVHQCSVWPFKYDFKFAGGTNYPCSLIYIDGVVAQSSSDANARTFYAISPTWGASYTTGIFISNGHVNGPEGAGSYTLEADGVEIELNNMYFDVAAGKGVLLGQTNPGTGSPLLICNNVEWDHPHPTNVLVKVTSSSFKTPTSYLIGFMAVTGKLELADTTQMALGPGWVMFAPDGTELSYPQVYGQLELQDPASATRNADARIFKSGTRLYVNHQTAAIQVAAATDVEVANGGDVTWKFDATGTLVSVGAGRDIGTNANAVGDIYLRDLLARNVEITGQFILANSKGVFGTDHLGNQETMLYASGTDNVEVYSFTSGGDLRIGNRAATGKVRFFPAAVASSALELDGSVVADETGVLLRANGSLLRVKVGAANSGPGGVGRALYAV